MHSTPYICIPILIYIKKFFLALKYWLFSSRVLYVYTVWIHFLVWRCIFSILVFTSHFIFLALLQVLSKPLPFIFLSFAVSTSVSLCSFYRLEFKFPIFFLFFSIHFPETVWLCNFFDIPIFLTVSLLHVAYSQQFYILSMETRNTHSSILSLLSCPQCFLWSSFSPVPNFLTLLPCVTHVWLLQLFTKHIPLCPHI